MPSGKTATPEIVDNKDGTVTVRYAPTEVGLHEMHIKYMGSHIPGESRSAPWPARPTCRTPKIQEPELLGGLQTFGQLLCGKQFSVAGWGMCCGRPCETRQPVTPAEAAYFQRDDTAEHPGHSAGP